MSVFAPLGPLGAGGPFGGYTGFGFSIPQGDPGAIEAAGSAAARLGQAFTEQGRSLQVAARIAVDGAGGWRGEASDAFAGYSGTLISTLSGNAGACDEAAGALRALSQALARAQQATRTALSECERYQQELGQQQSAAQEAGLQAQTALQTAASAPHPALASTYHAEAVSAQQQQGAAEAAARAASGELEAAKQRGHQAYTSYVEEAQALSARVGSAAGALKPAPVPAGGAPAPIVPTPGEVSLAANLIALASAGKISAPLIDAVPADERTPGLVYALLTSEAAQVSSAEQAGGARGPYSLWTSEFFGNSAPTVNAAVAAGLLPPMPSNWGSLSGPARQDFWRATSRFFSGITCEEGACSVVKVTGTGTANASQVLSHLTRDAEWATIGICVLGSDGACAAAARFTFGSETASNIADASSPANFAGREAITIATNVVGGGPLAIKSALGSEIEGVLPKSTFGRMGLNAFFTAPQAGMTAITPKITRSLLPPTPHPAPRHHGPR